MISGGLPGASRETKLIGDAPEAPKSRPELLGWSWDLCRAAYAFCEGLFILPCRGWALISAVQLQTAKRCLAAKATQVGNIGHPHLARTSLQQDWPLGILILEDRASSRTGLSASSFCKTQPPVTSQVPASGGNWNWREPASKDPRVCFGDGGHVPSERALQGSTQR